MALNIKNEEVHRLVEELATLTGESQTMAVRRAVEEKLQRVRVDRERRFQRVSEIAKECAASLPDWFKALSHKELDDMLYDEMGMPK